MLIRFYGVRGSIASPGAETVRYGGNTACVLIESDDGCHFIMDAGTGIKKLGEELMEKNTQRDIHLLFSHYHWDHIQGFPFFLPAYEPSQNIHLLAAHMKDEQTHAVLTQMTNPHFPIPSDHLEAQVNVLSTAKNRLKIGQTLITSTLLNHPGGGSAYRLDMPEASVAYVTDNELFSPNQSNNSFEEWVTFVQGVDYLIHDAMYLDEEKEKTKGWGHSLVSDTLKLAGEAGVANVILFHHEPSRTDKQLDQILLNSRQWMSQNYPRCQVYIAKEQDEYAISMESKHSTVLQSSMTV